MYCAFLNGIEWNTTGMSVGLIEEDSVECITNHLTSFAIVIFDAEVSIYMSTATFQISIAP